MGEPAWEGAGQEVGLQIWRIVVRTARESANVWLDNRGESECWQIFVVSECTVPTHVDL